MRLFITFVIGLLLSVTLNLPVLSQSSVEPAQLPTGRNLSLVSTRLRANRALWNRQDISNYRYTLSNSCFCLEEARGPAIIEVRNGRKISVTAANPGASIAPESFRRYNTIPKLFNLIRDAIKRKADSVEVQYNARLGYPINIKIDYSSQIADEEIFLTIENFAEVQ